MMCPSRWIEPDGWPSIRRRPDQNPGSPRALLVTIVIELASRVREIAAARRS